MSEAKCGGTGESWPGSQRFTSVSVTPTLWPHVCPPGGVAGEGAVGIGISHTQAQQSILSNSVIGCRSHAPK